MAICWGWTISLASWPALPRDEARPLSPHGPLVWQMDLRLCPRRACRGETETQRLGWFTGSCRARCQTLPDAL